MQIIKSIITSVLKRIITVKKSRKSLRKNTDVLKFSIHALNAAFNPFPVLIG